MRSSIPRFVVCSTLVVLLVPAASAAKGRSPLAALKQQYLDGLFRAKPHLATFFGDHRFDDRLPDRPRFRRMAGLIRAYVDQPLTWDCEITMEGRDLATVCVEDRPCTQLGFNTWIYSGEAPSMTCRALFPSPQTISS